jgi:hypothetical protein
VFSRVGLVTKNGLASFVGLAVALIQIGAHIEMSAPLSPCLSRGVLSVLRVFGITSFFGAA